jgi:hypothetical protein
MLIPKHKHECLLRPIKILTVLNNVITVSAAGKSSERMIRERRGSHGKSDESTDRDIAKRFPGLLPKALRTLAEAPLSRGTALK